MYGAYSQVQSSIFAVQDAPEVVAFARDVLSALPQLRLAGKDVPRLLTRVDVGCCHGRKRLFLNEIEFVPSLYSDAPGFEATGMEARLGTQMVRIAALVPRVGRPRSGRGSGAVVDSTVVITASAVLITAALVTATVLVTSRGNNRGARR